jgi:hypothetical protein
MHPSAETPNDIVPFSRLKRISLHHCRVIFHESKYFFLQIFHSIGVVKTGAVLARIWRTRERGRVAARGSGSECINELLGIPITSLCCLNKMVFVI